MSELKQLFSSKRSLGKLSDIRPSMIESYLNEALNIVLPGMTRMDFETLESFENYSSLHIENLERILSTLNLKNEEIKHVSKKYQSSLKNISDLLILDAKALLEGDPAANDISEIVLSYPGLYAIAAFRLAHFFYEEKIQIFPRMISECAHTHTGIDIHPGAVIGESFFIDHGTGVVIGETSVIGNRVKVYQGVTLGALSVDKSLKNVKRHPTISDDCVIYAHATILGGETVVGTGCVVGGNVWLTKSIPSDSIVYHQSVIKLDKKKGFNQEEELTYEI